MEDFIREKIALFRLSVIGILITGQLARGEIKKTIQVLTKRVYEIPGSKRTCIGFGTIEEWLLLYRKYGYDGLKPARCRKDTGKSRTISLELLEKIRSAMEQNRRRPLWLILRDLYQAGEIDSPDFPQSTIYHYFRKNPIKRGTAGKKEQKRFEFAQGNACWQCDVMHGPPVPHYKGQKPAKVFLISIIDDCSRLVVAAAFFPTEKLIHLKKVLKEAITTYGIPIRFYVDRGGIFRAHELQVALAKLATHHILGTAYYPEARGKTEKYHRRVRDQFLTSPSLQHIEDLAAFNAQWEKWLVNDYNKAPHEGIDNEIPLDRWLARTPHIKRLPDDIPIEELFYHQEKRLVKHDGTFPINKRLYEAGEHLIGKKIDVFFDNDAPESVLVKYQGRTEGHFKLVDKVANSKIKRKKFNKEDSDGFSGFFT